MNITPAYDVRQVAYNAREFVKQNKAEVWNIFKPFILFLFLLSLFDFIMLDIFLFDDYLGLRAGNVIMTYFMSICTISYYRLVFHSRQDYEPAKMFSPTKSNFSFVVMALIFSVGSSVFISLIMSLVSGVSIFNQYVVSGILFMVQTIILCRISFCFVAAAIDQKMGVKESVQKTNGFVFKLIFAFIIASWRVFVSIVLCVFLISFTSLILQEIGFSEKSMNMILFVIVFLVMVYVLPKLMALSAYVVSNYYAYVQQDHASENIT